MSKIKNSQSFQISGSPGVSIGSIEQNLLATGEREEQRQAPVKILFLAANPSGTDPLRLDLEARSIEQALLASGARDRFELQQSWAVSPADLQDSLLRYQPEVVHFSGHGGSAGELALESFPHPRHLMDSGEQSPPEEAQVQPLAQLVSLANGGGIRCVLLNACDSEPLALALAEKVDCVIGMTSSIEDSAALRFSWAFYHAIGRGESVRKAFDLGCAQAGFAAPSQSQIPRLLALRINPDSIVL